MKRKWKTGIVIVLCCLCFAVLWTGIAPAAKPVSSDAGNFPRSLESYNDTDAGSIWAILNSI
jgi:hypothetical protein